MQPVCGPLCEAAMKRARAKKAAAEKGAQPKRLKPVAKATPTSKAQDAFNAWVRERDYFLPCVSCGAERAVWHAGHFRTVGACPELRFEPDNAHKQCERCNVDESGNVAQYRTRLEARIGVERLAALEGPHAPKRYTDDDFNQIARRYRALTRELVAQRERGLRHA
jgi:hypothetical protein